MINKLIINKTATYTSKVEIEPTEINYFYGSNGSGKTTLSKVIADASSYPDCSLTWQTTPIETLVYNRDFVKTHFSQSSAIKGIFTLGKDATEAKDFIEKAKKKIDNHVNQLRGLKSSLENKIKEEDKLRNAIINKCWNIKKKYQDQFIDAYKGFSHSK